MSVDALLVFCTCPNRESAEQIAGRLLERGLAACVTISSPVTSLYIWEGERESAEEIQLLIKTTRECYDALEQAIFSLHPYELPEIIAVSVDWGFSRYLNWVEQCTKTTS